MVYFASLVMLKSISKSRAWCINMCSVVKYFKIFFPYLYPKFGKTKFLLFEGKNEFCLSF